MTSATKLTFCGNVHPAEDLADWCAAVAEHDAAVATAVQTGPRSTSPFGLGVWWNARMAAELRASPDARARVQDTLEEHGLSIWTLNVFPYGDFHADVVKAAVYEPSWADPDRLRYTLDAAATAAELVPVGSTLPISTVPLGYGPMDLGACGAALRRAAAELAELEERTGTTVVLALEAEPFCVLERTAQVMAFLEHWVFAGVSSAEEERLRKHLGVCLDLCHAAVLREDPLAIVADLRAREIGLAKVQVSSCLELRAVADAQSRAAGFDALLAFDEPRYLHQTVAENGARALDLAEVAARREEFLAAGRIRTHFHVPVDWDDGGPLGSTRSEVVQFLRGCPSPLPLLEVETYTWSVLETKALPRAVEPDGDPEAEDQELPPLAERIAAELLDVRAQLGGASTPSASPKPDS